jgi:hypothetical protein
MDRLQRSPIEIRSRVWRRLLSAAREAQRRFVAGPEPGLGSLGLHLQLQERDGWASPINVVQFATNGAEAEFGFLVSENRIDDNSPIIQTNYGSGEQLNFVVGKSLHDFLCLGYHRGYFGLEQLSYDVKQTLAVFGSSKWAPQTDRDWSIGFGVNENQAAILRFLRRRLQLSPWRNITRKFKSLQAKFLPQLELRADRFTVDLIADEIKGWSRWRE